MTEEAETTYLATVRRQWALRKRSSKTRHFKVVKGRFVSHKVKPPKKLDVVIAAAITAKKATLEIGNKMADGTIYLGRYSPRDRDGKSLGKTFNVFAAPQDLADTDGRTTFTYADTVERLAGLKGWNGFDGAHYATDKELYQALKDDSYTGGWVIPPRELLAGTAAEGPAGIRQGRIVQPDNLFDHRNEGDLKDSFTMAGAVPPDGYWSSTERSSNSGNFWRTLFSEGHEDWYYKDRLKFGCRPVRLVPTRTRPEF